MGLDATGWQALAALVALAALAGGALRWREQALRREEVLAWGAQAIEALQSLVLLCALPAGRIDPAVAEARLSDVIFQTSILTEQGRMFFKNTRVGRIGKDKPAAYRGRRPAILDHLIAAHEAAVRLAGGVDLDSRARLSLVAEDSLKGFVSLIQSEVGRSRVRSPAAGKPGESIRLELLMARLNPARVDERLRGD